MRYKSLVIEVPLVQEAEGPTTQCAGDIYELVRRDLVDLAQETVLVITLTQKNKVIERHVLGVGTLTECMVHPRDVFRHAIMDNAAAIAIVHNHPTGDPAPSRGDRMLTTRLKECADLMGIRLIDHVIVGKGKYYSFAEAGALGS